MATVERAGAEVDLKVDLTTGTAIVDGGRTDLPPKEFALLAHLAARPGQAVSRAELIEAIWPETPLMTDQDLYWYVNRLRKNIGDDHRQAKVIANRRGFGYFLDLTTARVGFTGSASGEPITYVEPTLEPVPDPDLEERPVPLVASAEEAPLTHPKIPVQPEVRRSLPMGRKSTAVIAAALISVLFATAWSATRTNAPTQQGPSSVADKPEEVGKKERPGEKGTEARSHPRQDETTVGSGSGRQVAAAPADTEDTTQRQSAITSGAGRTEQKEPTEQLPPPPTRFLYHLVNQETGDHFVTTDPAKSSEREASGYVGGAIARVYTNKHPGTKAISTNYGRAYIFVSATPETSPSSKTTPLWFVSDGAGDFYYVTSQADIPEQGWSAALIGHVVPQ